MTLNPRDMQKVVFFWILSDSLKKIFEQLERERKELERQERVDKEKIEKLEKQMKKQEDKEKRQTMKLLSKQTRTLKKSSIPSESVVNMYYSVLLVSALFLF